MNKTFNSMFLLNLFCFELPAGTRSFVTEARGAWGGDFIGLCGVKRVLGEVLLPCSGHKCSKGSLGR